MRARRSDRLHFAGFPTGPTPFAVNLADAVPFAIMGSDESAFGYTLKVHTREDSSINAMEDITNKRIAHTSPNHRQPRVVLGGTAGHCNPCGLGEL
ncbi:MAG: PhnD/SsuA/transferrin family substrate-binding protein [Pseudomonadota bacterium]|uniref:PhnD/SsuA/transferrin family substrate-binding protein n=1 Tax=Roseovarius TaxID=74030 RepID=UPI002E23973F